MSEQDSAFFQTLTMVLGGLFVFFIIIIVAAMWVGDDDVASDDPRIQAKVAELIKPVGQVKSDSGATMVSAAPAKAETAAASPAGSSIDVAAEYQGKCFACHGTGAAGAPKLGDKAAWKARIAAGDAIYTNAIKGKGAMPPKGGQASLSDADVKAIVDYMISKSK